MSRRPSSIPDALYILFSDPKFPGGATHSELYAPLRPCSKTIRRRFGRAVYPAGIAAPAVREHPDRQQKKGGASGAPPYNRSGGRYYMTMAPNRLRSRNTAATVRMEYSSGNAARINVLPMTL